MYLHTGNYSYIPTMHRVKKITEFGEFSSSNKSVNKDILLNDG